MFWRIVKGQGTLNFTNTSSNSANLTPTNISNVTTTPTLVPNIIPTTSATQHLTPSSVLSETQRDARLLQQLSQQQQRSSSNMSISGVGSPVNSSRDNLASDSIVNIIDGSTNWDVSMIRIRAKFVQALIRTLSLNLTKRKGWMPFSFSSLVYQDQGLSLYHSQWDGLTKYSFIRIQVLVQKTTSSTMHP